MARLYTPAHQCLLWRALTTGPWAEVPKSTFTVASSDSRLKSPLMRSCCTASMGLPSKRKMLLQRRQAWESCPLLLFFLMIILQQLSTQITNSCLGYSRPQRYVSEAKNGLQLECVSYGMRTTVSLLRDCCGAQAISVVCTVAQVKSRRTRICTEIPYQRHQMACVATGSERQGRIITQPEVFPEDSRSYKCVCTADARTRLHG